MDFGANIRFRNSEICEIRIGVNVHVARGKSGEAGDEDLDAAIAGFANNGPNSAVFGVPDLSRSAEESRRCVGALFLRGLFGALVGIARNASVHGGADECRNGGTVSIDESGRV